MLYSQLMNIYDLDSDQDLFHYADAKSSSRIYLKQDPKTHLRAIITLHNVSQGPALGGCRCIAYPSTFAAMVDALRLAKGMSYKSALIGIPFGGGKAVLLKPDHIPDRVAYFKAFGQFVNSLAGQYITAIDSGTTMEDMDVIAQTTPYVASTSNMNESPSPYTADGVFYGIQASVAHVFKRSNLKGLRVAVQGVGEVGRALVKLLAKAQANIYVSDTNRQNLDLIKQQYPVHILEPEDIYSADVDILAPCALGGTLNEQIIPTIQAKIIAGAANNQLEKASDGLRLHERNILYAPDYVINAGGLIFASGRYQGYPVTKLAKIIHHIYDTLMEVFQRSQENNLPTSFIAQQMAEERLYSCKS